MVPLLLMITWSWRYWVGIVSWWRPFLMTVWLYFLSPLSPSPSPLPPLSSSPSPLPSVPRSPSSPRCSRPLWSASRSSHITPHSSTSSHQHTGTQRDETLVLQNIRKVYGILCHLQLLHGCTIILKLNADLSLSLSLSLSPLWRDFNLILTPSRDSLHHSVYVSVVTEGRAERRHFPFHHFYTGHLRGAYIHESILLVIPQYILVISQVMSTTTQYSPSNPSVYSSNLSGYVYNYSVFS